MIKLNAIAAIEQFEKFCARGKDHHISLYRCQTDKDSMVMLLKCDYYGKCKQGTVIGRIEFSHLSEKGEINKMLHDTFNDFNNRMDEFDTPEKKDVFT